MKSYCVRQKKQTECVPRSERIVIASNGRQMLACVCAECGITKTQFAKEQSGRGISKHDFACGYNLRGKRPGTLSECFNIGQVRQWGVNQLDNNMIQQMVTDKKNERNRKARERRQAKKPKVKKYNFEIPKKEDLSRPDHDKKFAELMRGWDKMKKPAGTVKITKKKIKERLDEWKTKSGFIRDGKYFMMKFDDGDYGPSIYDPDSDSLKTLKKTSKNDAVNIYYNLVNYGKETTGKPAVKKKAELISNLPEKRYWDEAYLDALIDYNKKEICYLHKQDAGRYVVQQTH